MRKLAHRYNAATARHSWSMSRPTTKNIGHARNAGQLRRSVSMGLADELKLYEQVRIRQKQKGTSGYVHDQIIGDDYTKATGKFNKKVRIIDLKNDQYYESVTNSETGELLHLRHEKLSEHYGRGSAKWQPHNFPHEHVAVAAYFIWEKEGRPDGRAPKHWEMAIEDLRGRLLVLRRCTHSRTCSVATSRRRFSALFVLARFKVQERCPAVTLPVVCRTDAPHSRGVGVRPI